MGIQVLDAKHFSGHRNITLGNCAPGEDLATILNMYMGALLGPGLVLHVDGKYGRDVSVDAADRYPKGKVPWGTSWDRAFATIQAALVVARGAGTGSDPSLDANYDQDHAVTVLVAPGNYAENPIMVGAGIRLIGLGYPGTDRGVSITPPDKHATYPGSMIVQGSGLEIANIEIINDYAYPTIWFDLMHSSWVHDMVLYGDGSATAAFQTNGMKNSIIERNRISMFSTYGIEVNYDVTQTDYFIGSQIRNNRIGKGTGTGIVVDNLLVAYDSYIQDNIVEGEGLTLCIDNNATGPVIVTGNRCMIDADEATAIQSASTNGGMVKNSLVYNAGTKIVNNFPADA